MKEKFKYVSINASFYYKGIELKKINKHAAIVKELKKSVYISPDTKVETKNVDLGTADKPINITKNNINDWILGLV
mgnify:CR=1 FL=1